MHMWHFLLDGLAGFDKLETSSVITKQLEISKTTNLNSIVIVFFKSGGNGEDVCVENDVMWRKSDLRRKPIESADQTKKQPNLFGQQLVGSATDGHLAGTVGGLALLIERHHNHGRSIAPHQTRLLQENLQRGKKKKRKNHKTFVITHFFAFFQRNRVHNGLSLQTAKGSLHNMKLARIYNPLFVTES